MTTSPAPYTPAVPCAQWADLLAAPEQQLSPAERARLESHLTSCAACAAVRDEYRRMDSQIRALPAPRPLTGLPPALLDMWAREDVQRVAELPFYGASEMSSERTQSVQRSPAASRRHRAAGPIGALAAVLILGALIGGYYAMLANHSAPGPQTSSATPSYGPPVDPPGPRASIGASRMLALPPGAPDRAQQIAEPGAGDVQPTGGAQIYEQPAVAGLLYAVSPPAGTTQLRMWRSDDAGRTWKQLALPPSAAALPTGESAIRLVFDARDPDTVLFWGFNLSTVSSVRLYSLDRGATWHTLQMPAGSDAWNVTLPMADGGTWYLPVWVAAQPAIWTTRDHGVTWTSHAYPMAVPNRAPGQSYAWAGTLLDVDYTSGGILWAYQHTLWWSPDDGATWQRLGTWGTQPCDGEIAATPDLSVLYCLFSNGPVYGQVSPDQRPIWRSDDRGQTWTAIPGGPAIAPLASDPTGGITRAVVLFDGSLLTVAPSREQPDEVALYTLKRGANVWHEASAPLAPPLGYCLPSQPSQPSQPGPNAPAIEPECATPLEINITAGSVTQGKTSQLIYITHATSSAVTNPVYVAMITWK